MDEQVEFLRALLKGVEWRGKPVTVKGEPTCPHCYQSQEKGHNPMCGLNRELQTPSQREMKIQTIYLHGNQYFALKKLSSGMSRPMSTFLREGIDLIIKKNAELLK